jgi:hypothetical protein
MSWSKNVYSSMVSEIGYDDETQELLVTWTNGRRSAYSGVPEGLADQLSRAPSVGGMINADIKGVFPHRYV